MRDRPTRLAVPPAAGVDWHTRFEIGPCPTHRPGGSIKATISASPTRRLSPALSAFMRGFKDHQPSRDALVVLRSSGSQVFLSEWDTIPVGHLLGGSNNSVSLLIIAGVAALFRSSTAVVLEPVKSRAKHVPARVIQPRRMLFPTILMAVPLVNEMGLRRHRPAGQPYGGKKEIARQPLPPRTCFNYYVQRLFRDNGYARMPSSWSGGRFRLGTGSRSHAADNPPNRLRSSR